MLLEGQVYISYIDSVVEKDSDRYYGGCAVLAVALT